MTSRAAREDAEALLAKLREPVDQGGYDGYEPDAHKLAAAACIEDLAMQLETAHTLLAAWQKRAYEAEAREGALLDSTRQQAREIERYKATIQRMNEAVRDALGINDGSGRGIVETIQEREAEVRQLHQEIKRAAVFDWSCG